MWAGYTLIVLYTPESLLFNAVYTQYYFSACGVYENVGLTHWNIAKAYRADLRGS